MLLEYAEAMLEYGQFRVAYEAAVSYERFVKPDDKVNAESQKPSPYKC